MLKPQFLILTVILAGLLSRAPAAAQTGARFATLEAQIQAAPRVVCGRIADLQRTVFPAIGRRPDGTVVPKGRVEYRITIQVDEVLRGRAQKRLLIGKETSASDRHMQEWQQAQSTLLWFIQASTGSSAPGEKRLPEDWDVLRLDPESANTSYYNVPSLPVYSMDLTVLGNPRAVLQRARAFIRSGRVGKKLLKLMISREMADRVGASGDYNDLIVPLVPGLERIAQRLILHPESIQPGLPGTWLSPNLRLDTQEIGLQELRNFDTAPNRQLLRGLLQKRGERELRVRAAKTLAAWISNSVMRKNGRSPSPSGAGGVRPGNQKQ